MADIFLLEACAEKALNNQAFFLAENAVLHFLKEEKMHSLAGWTQFCTTRLSPKSATEMTVAVQGDFIHLQA